MVPSLGNLSVIRLGLFQSIFGKLRFWFSLSFEIFPLVFPLRFSVLSLIFSQFYVNLEFFCKKSFRCLEKWAKFILFLLLRDVFWVIFYLFKTFSKKFAKTMRFFFSGLTFDCLLVTHSTNFSEPIFLGKSVALPCGLQWQMRYLWKD